MYPNYNNQFYMQDLQNMRDRIDKQMQQMQLTTQPQQQTPITQNFQLAPNQSNSSSIKYAEAIDDVKNELVFGDTLFINKAYTTMWLKNARGEIKTYEVKEVVVLDEKDAQIENLKAQIEELKKEMANREQYDDKYVNDKITRGKPARGNSGKTDDGE
jgi:hypothetical protein